MTALVFQILFVASSGMALSFGFVRPEQVGRKYFLIHGLIAATTALLGFLFIGVNVLGLPTSISCWVFTAALILFSVLSAKWKKLMLASYLLSLTAALVTLYLFSTFEPPVGLLVPFLVNTILSSTALGFTLAGMLLGHWYLTQPKMAIEELKRITLIMTVAIGIRFLYGTGIAVLHLMPLSENEIYQYLLSGGSGTFLLMRYLWGLLLPSLLCYFIWKTVGMRSTQSATGILYVQTLFIVTGEILSLYLAQFHGIYL